MIFNVFFSFVFCFNTDIIYQLANYDDENNNNNNNNNGEHLRPLLEEHMADEAVLQMVRRCWHEDPNERPDFVTLQSIIRRINKYIFKYIFCFRFLIFHY